MWHFGTWFSRHGGVGAMAGLHDLRGAVSWAQSWWLGCVGEQEAPAGACWRWDPGAICWTDWFNAQFYQTKLKCLQESPGQKQMETPAFTVWMKPRSGEMMHTKWSSNFFLLANYHGSISITLWEDLVFLSLPVKQITLFCIHWV